VTLRRAAFTGGLAAADQAERRNMSLVVWFIRRDGCGYDDLAKDSSFRSESCHSPFAICHSPIALALALGATSIPLSRYCGSSVSRRPRDCFIASTLSPCETLHHTAREEFKLCSEEPHHDLAAFAQPVARPSAASKAV
jgi:hypothetical protein